MAELPKGNIIMHEFIPRFILLIFFVVSSVVTSLATVIPNGTQFSTIRLADNRRMNSPQGVHAFVIDFLVDHKIDYWPLTGTIGVDRFRYWMILTSMTPEYTALMVSNDNDTWSAAPVTGTAMPTPSSPPNTTMLRQWCLADQKNDYDSGRDDDGAPYERYCYNTEPPDKYFGEWFISGKLQEVVIPDGGDADPAMVYDDLNDRLLLYWVRERLATSRGEYNSFGQQYISGTFSVPAYTYQATCESVGHTWTEDFADPEKNVMSATINNSLVYGNEQVAVGEDLGTRDANMPAYNNRYITPAVVKDRDSL